MLVFIFTCSKKTRQAYTVLYTNEGCIIPLWPMSPFTFFGIYGSWFAPFLTSCVVFGGIQFPTFPCLTKLVRIPACVWLFQFSQQLAVQWLTRANKPFFSAFRNGVDLKWAYLGILFQVFHYQRNGLFGFRCYNHWLYDPGGLIRGPQKPRLLLWHSTLILWLCWLLGLLSLLKVLGSNVLDSTGLAFAVVEVVAAQLAIASVVLAASVLASVEPAFAVVAFAVLALLPLLLLLLLPQGDETKCWASITHVSASWQEQMVIKSIPCILSAQLHWSLKATWNEIDGSQKRSRDSEK